SRLRRQRLRAHRQRQHGDGDRQAPGDGPGNVHRPADAGRRGARRRLVEGAPADAAKYNDLLWGPAQGTGGSTALANSWEQMRKAGAAARAMLVAAAAQKWKVDPSAIRVAKGVLSWKKNKATFGQLAAEAGKQKVPADVKLKDPRHYV